MNIRVNLDTPIKDGTEVVFRSPVDCSQVTGMIVYYMETDGNTASQEFVFADAHGNNVGDIDHLFAENVAVKVILDVTTSMAFVQNADTNAYLEGRLDGLSDSIICQVSGSSIIVEDSSDRKLLGLNLYGKTTQDGAPTPDAPVELVSVGDNGSVDIAVLGTRNLFGGNVLADKLVSVSDEADGVTPTTKNEGDGTITFHGANVNGKKLYEKFKPNTRYTFIFYGKNKSKAKHLNLAIYYTDGTIVGLNFASDENTSLHYVSEANKSVKCFASTYSGGTTMLYYDKCGIFEGIVLENEFEPFNGGYLKTSTPNGLRGVTTTKAGNYTDANGQNWLCDEIDFERGVKIQRFGIVEDMSQLSWNYYTTGSKYFYAWVAGKANSNNDFLCSCYKTVRTANDFIQGTITGNFYSTGTGVHVRDSNYTDVETFKASLVGQKLVYRLATPVETPLTEEELNAYKALHTYQHTTMVTTDSLAVVGVKYVADTKAYIDNKFTELQNAILSAGANV